MLTFEYVVLIIMQLGTCDCKALHVVSALLHTAIHCNTLHHTAPHCTTLQHLAFVNTLSRMGVVLQPTATYCNTWHV